MEEEEEEKKKICVLINIYIKKKENTNFTLWQK